jgi:hypothetical protein
MHCSTCTVRPNETGVAHRHYPRQRTYVPDITTMDHRSLFQANLAPQQRSATYPHQQCSWLAGLQVPLRQALPILSTCWKCLKNTLHFFILTGACLMPRILNIGGHPHTNGLRSRCGMIIANPTTVTKRVHRLMLGVYEDGISLHTGYILQTVIGQTRLPCIPTAE